MTDHKGPREYWIRPINGVDCEWTNLYPDDTWGHKYHVIEKSALDTEKARADKWERECDKLALAIQDHIQFMDNQRSKYLREALAEFEKAKGESNE